MRYEDVKANLIAQEGGITADEVRCIEIEAAILSDIRRARRDKNISQKTLESLSGVRQPTIAKIEGGQTNPSLHTLMKLLDALGKTIVIQDQDTISVS